MLTHPTIIVPGITASHLRDVYPMPPEDIWTTFRKKYGRVALHPDDPRYEYMQPSLIRPDQIYRVVYEELVEELRDELSDINDTDVPVFPFAYDWRKPLGETQQLLRKFMDEVIDRTLLLPRYRKRVNRGDLKVNLVGHSMGRLVIARCLTDQKDNPPPVNKVATLATPFQGSFEAIVKLVVGVGNLGGDKPSHKERRAARATPSLYQLLPTFPLRESIFGCGIKADFLDTDSWQPSVFESLRKYIKGAELLERHEEIEIAAKKLFERFLSQAQANRNLIGNLKLADFGLESKWLAIVGVNEETLVEVRVKNSNGFPQFEFDRSHERNEWDENDPETLKNTGDGVVPFDGARPPFLKDSELVLVQPKDFGRWELKDKFLNSFSGFHGMIPNMNLVQRILLRFLTEGNDRDKYGNTWGLKVPGVCEWEPPLDLGVARNE